MQYYLIAALLFYIGSIAYGLRIKELRKDPVLLIKNMVSLLPFALLWLPYLVYVAYRKLKPRKVIKPEYDNHFNEQSF